MKNGEKNSQTICTTIIHYFYFLFRYIDNLNCFVNYLNVPTSGEHE